MDKTFHKRRGGARPGAGRPKAEHPRRSLTIRLEEDVEEIVSSVANKSQFVNECIRAFANPDK